jgi:D-alanine-D-alanine ligase
MDKAWTKYIASCHGINVSPFIDFSIQEWLDEPHKVKRVILERFKYPFYIKACHLGSSLGVYKIKQEEDITEALDALKELDYRFLVEEEVIGREIEFGFIGDHSIQVSKPTEVIPAGDLHTYENKYSSSGNPSITNVNLPDKIAKIGQDIALKVYKTLNCKGLARIDFFLKKDGTWVLNEVNPIPGMTLTSAYPAMWKELGYTMTSVLDKVIIASFHRDRCQKRHLRPPKQAPAIS